MDPPLPTTQRLLSSHSAGSPSPTEEEALQTQSSQRSYKPFTLPWTAALKLARLPLLPSFHSFLDRHRCNRYPKLALPTTLQQVFHLSSSEPRWGTPFSFQKRDFGIHNSRNISKNPAPVDKIQASVRSPAFQGPICNTDINNSFPYQPIFTYL